MVYINKKWVATKRKKEIHMNATIYLIQKDIEHMFGTLIKIRKFEDVKDIATIDFKPYRSMVDSLLKTFDTLNKLYNYNILKENAEFSEYFYSSLVIEKDKLRDIITFCRDNQNQYRCLNDAYLKLIEKIDRIDKDRPAELKERFINIIIPKEVDISIAKIQQFVDMTLKTLPDGVKVKYSNC
jgi:hypothetical protein